MLRQTIEATSNAATVKSNGYHWGEGVVDSRLFTKHVSILTRYYNNEIIMFWLNSITMFNKDNSCYSRTFL